MDDWREEVEEARRRINVLQMNLEDDVYEKSNISKYFSGKCVLLTGGAGFLGQLYLEKLLRVGASRVYLLLRPKKNMSPMDRLEQICSGPIFELLRKRDPHFERRIEVFDGNLTELQMGLSARRVKMIQENVQIVIHAAADIRFNVPLLDLIQSNVRGTKEMLEMARGIRQLETFAYVSTAYSNCIHSDIEERFYDAPMDPHFWLKMLDHCTEQDKERMRILEAHIMNPWPNSYTYSKALSESLVKEYSKTIPTVVMRPSIVVSTYRDPIPGWTNNLTGINGLCVGIGIGFLRHLNVKKDFAIDIICADYVINSTLAAIWVTASKHLASAPGVTIEPEIFHVTRQGFTLTPERLVNDSLAVLNSGELHSMKCIYYPTILLIKSDFLDTILSILLQAVPSYLLDFFNTDKRIRLMAISRKMQSMRNVISFFMTTEFNFAGRNIREKVFDKMSDADKQLFPADCREFEWHKFHFPYYAGLRVYAMEDPIESWPRSRKWVSLLRNIHYIVKSISVLAMALLLYFYVLQRLFNL